MSSFALDMVRSPFSTAAFAQLVWRLRHTNTRYNQIAHQFRHRSRPTHHAKRRACCAGLRIDTSKALTFTTTSFSILPVIDSAFPTPTGAMRDAEEGHEEGECMHALRLPPLRSLPEVVLLEPHGCDGHQRVALRLPPLKLALGVDYGCGAPYQGPVPNAPRLLPKQLPEEESGVEEMTLGSASSSDLSFIESEDSLLTPEPVDGQVCSGLCMTIPPRYAKRKIEELEADENLSPKRILRARWNESQRQ